MDPNKVQVIRSKKYHHRPRAVTLRTYTEDSVWWCTRFALTTLEENRWYRIAGEGRELLVKRVGNELFVESEAEGSGSLILGTQEATDLIDLFDSYGQVIEQPID